jgi:hypothetical protein
LKADSKSDSEAASEPVTGLRLHTVLALDDESLFAVRLRICFQAQTFVPVVSFHHFNASRCFQFALKADSKSDSEAASEPVTGLRLHTVLALDDESLYTGDVSDRPQPCSPSCDAQS